MLKYLVHRPKWIVVVVGLLIFWLTQNGWLAETSFWQKTEGALVDWTYHHRGRSLPDARIKLVGIGDTAFQLDTLSPEEIAASPVLQKMQQPWPWDRSVYAAILEKLMDAGAKVVAFDFLFGSATDGDDAFAQDLLKYKDHVVIGAEIEVEKGATGKTLKLSIPNGRLTLPGTETIAGLVNVYPDRDGVVRRARYRTSLERDELERGDPRPEIAKFYRKGIANGSIPDNLVHFTARAAEKFRGTQIAIPSPNEWAFISFQGEGGMYRPLPVEQMFVDGLWATNRLFKGGLAFSNKIVIVGPTAEIFKDTHATPFGEMPGPEIHAQTLAALLQGQWLTESSDSTNFWLVLGAVALALFICLAVPQALLKSLLIIVSVLSLAAGSEIALTYNNCVVDIVPPLFCLLATSSFGIVFEYTLEQLERRRYRNLLNRYVSKNVAKAILADWRSFDESMLGIKKPVTVLFSDIRGFTTMTESRDATLLVAQLNEYFAEMVDIIQENHSGTLQKFIGDAIMAAWGDVYSHGIDVDAKRSVMAALEMRAALKRMNDRWKDNPDRIVLSTGIGVNHGEVVYGNIGSVERTELTVLGDGVNLAARLESATKQFHTDILVGEDAERLTRDHFVYRKVGAVAFKGKTKPIETFIVISDSTVPPPAWLEPYHEAVKLYRHRQFREAAERFKHAQLQIYGGDFLCDMYLARCEAFELSPPPEDWDGSFTLSEK